MMPRLKLYIVIGLAGAWASEVAAQDCKSGSQGVPGTLAAPSNPCPPAAKKKPDPIRKQAKEPDSFWSGVHVGGSLGTTTTIRGR
jgi:hypothetical protein